MPDALAEETTVVKPAKERRWGRKASTPASASATATAAPRPEDVEVVNGGRVVRIVFHGDHDVTSGHDVLAKARPTGAPADVPLGRIARAPEVEPAAPTFRAPPPAPAAPPTVPGETLRSTTVTRTYTGSRPAGSMDSLHNELDRRFGIGLPSTGARTLYKTDSGAVRAYDGPGGRAITVSSLTASGQEEERRFSSRMVDPIVKDVRLEEETVVRETVTELVAEPSDHVYRNVQPASAAEVEAERRSRWSFFRRTKTETREDVGQVSRGEGWTPPAEPAPAAASPGLEATAPAQHAPRRRFAFGRKRKAAPEPKPEPALPASEYQPQCAALTDDGVQCRNSSRGGSKYCSSHKGYRPPTLDQVVAAKDTAPRHDAAPDSAPLETGAWEPGNELQAQCAALTADGKQCRNSSREGSSFCASHKGYRAPSAAKLKKGLDTKPRWAKAPDTKPALSKAKRSKPRKATKKR